MFARPEMKVERVSYDVITPSAARGVLEALHWKPAMVWRVHRLRVLKPASRFYDLTLASVTRKGRRPQLVLETFLEALAKTG